MHSANCRPAPSRSGLRSGRASIVGIAALLALSCGPGTPPDPVEDAAPSAPEATIAERLATLGCMECAHSEGLAPKDVQLAGEELRVLDGFEPFLRTFDLDGNLLWQAVTEGEGPGEMTMPVRMYDLGDGRIALHNGVPPFLLLVTGETGEQLAKVELPMRVFENADLNPATGQLYLLNALPFVPGPDGAPRVDLINLASGEEARVLEVGALPAIPSTAEQAGPKARFAIAATANGNLLVGHPWEYEIRAHAPDGSLVGTFGRELARPAAPERIEGEPGDLIDRGIYDGDDTELPHFDRFALDRDTVRDELWVRTLRGDLAAEALFDRFSAAGEYLGEVVVPMPMQRDTEHAFDVEDGRLAAVHPTGEGEVVVLWRVVED